MFFPCFLDCCWIQNEFEAHSDNFPNKSEKIEFMKELIADIEECIERVENEK